MKASKVLRKMASLIHGRRATYVIRANGLTTPADRTVLQYDPWQSRYYLALHATMGCEVSPANTRELPQNHSLCDMLSRLDNVA